MRHLVHGTSERELVCLGGPRETAQLSDELQRRRPDLIVRSRGAKLCRSCASTMGISFSGRTLRAPSRAGPSRAAPQLARRRCEACSFAGSTAREARASAEAIACGALGTRGGRATRTSVRLVDPHRRSRGRQLRVAGRPRTGWPVRSGRTPLCAAAPVEVRLSRHGSGPRKLRRLGRLASPLARPRVRLSNAGVAVSVSTPPRTDAATSAAPDARSPVPFPEPAIGRRR